MDKLFQTVKRSLNELVIPPLHNIVNAFLPDRGILEPVLYHDATRAKQMTLDFPVTFQLEYSTIYGILPSGRWFIPKFDRKLLKFEPFTINFENCTFGPENKRMVIVYQGEPEIVQIE